MKYRDVSWTIDSSTLESYYKYSSATSTLYSKIKMLRLQHVTNQRVYLYVEVRIQHSAKRWQRGLQGTKSTSNYSKLPSLLVFRWWLAVENIAFVKLLSAMRSAVLASAKFTSYSRFFCGGNWTWNSAQAGRLSIIESIFVLVLFLIPHEPPSPDTSCNNARLSSNMASRTSGNSLSQNQLKTSSLFELEANDFLSK